MLEKNVNGAGCERHFSVPSKGNSMKTVLQFAVLAIFVTTIATAQEIVKVKVAVIRIDAIEGGDNSFYDKARLLTCDKSILTAVKKINAELKNVQKQIIDVEDNDKLAELGRRVEFLNQKLNTLREQRQQGVGGNPNLDLQAMIRKFVVGNYKDKYLLILWQDSRAHDRAIIWKGDVQIDDITDDVSQKFRDYLDTSLGE
jgi:septal ring factor EnvC (AmiA/AmiB activator)